MQHNTAVRFLGKCECPCHVDGRAACTCGAPDILRGPLTPKHLRSGKLTSRVKAFGKRVGLVMAVTKHHDLHELKFPKGKER